MQGHCYDSHTEGYFISLLSAWYIHLVTTVEPRYNEPLNTEVIDIMNDFLYPNNSKIYEKEPRYNETSL